MSDKESFSNHVRILENTPARCVVLWRYPLVDVLHVIANYDQQTGWGDWSDWTYTIYPDGVAAKELRCWTDGSSGHEWQEGMVITGPDQHPEQVLETDPALRLVTLDGEVRDYSWKNGPPKGVDYQDVKIHVVNYQGQYDPFTIADIDGGNVYSGEVTDYSVFPSWNHWPVAQMPSDGRYAKHPDRTAHSSLTHVRGPLQQGDNPDRPFQRMFMLEGLSTKTPEALIKLARSWLHAPDIEARVHAQRQRTETFVVDERAGDLVRQRLPGPFDEAFEQPDRDGPEIERDALVHQPVGQRQSLGQLPDPRDAVQPGCAHLQEHPVAPQHHALPAGESRQWTEHRHAHAGTGLLQRDVARISPDFSHHPALGGRAPARATCRAAPAPTPGRPRADHRACRARTGTARPCT